MKISHSSKRARNRAHPTLIRSADSLAALGGRPVFSSLPPVAWPPVDKATERELVRIYRSRKWSFSGPVEREFCRQFAKAHTAKHAVFMVNGTVTLEAALHVLGVGRGDEVIVPGLTWPATAMAAIFVGAKPVFVDIEPDTLCLDPDKVAEAITPRTKAIIPVHLYGGMADMDRLLALARKHHLHVIEDCAHAHGGRWGQRGLGSLGVIGSFSFQESKSMPSGEGGAVLTNDAVLAERLFRFKHIGYQVGVAPGKATTSPPEGLICHNYRGTEFPAAILLGQLKHLKTMAARRAHNAQFLARGLAQIPGVQVQACGRKANPQSYYGYLTMLDPSAWAGASRAQIHVAFAQEGLPMNRTYGTVYRHALWNLPPSAYRIHGGYRDARGAACRVSEDYGDQRAYWFLHWRLDWSKSNLEKIIATFAKLQRHAHRIAALRVP